jgi:hypothetical protein
VAQLMKTSHQFKGRWASLLIAVAILVSVALRSWADVQIAFVSDGTNKWSNWDIYLRNLTTGTTTRLTTNSAVDNHPDLSPIYDGSNILDAAALVPYTGLNRVLKHALVDHGEHTRLRVDARNERLHAGHFLALCRLEL